MKFRKHFRICTVIICSVYLILSFSSCTPVNKILDFFSDDGTGHVFKIAIDVDPENLDPQLANDRVSVMIAKNMFCGLMKIDEKGRLAAACAKDYTVSEDGLTYTFNLVENCEWAATGGFSAPVTAYDFLFGFKRLFDPKTNSPHSAKYFCIKNSEGVRYGNVSVDDLGVRVIDDLTLEIELEYPNAELIYLLTELPAMPCCEEFFNTSGGKYGLEAEATCSNGPFYIRYWLHDPYGKDNYVRLRRNDGYAIGDVCPSGVTYLVTPDQSEKLSDFTGGVTDVILYDAGETVETDGDTMALGGESTVGLVLNPNIKIFSDPDIRQIFSWAIDRESINSSAPKLIKPASQIIPDTVKLSGTGYSSLTLKEVTETNLAMAEYKWSFILSDGEKSDLIGMTILIPDNFGYSEYISELVDSWYNIFKVHFSVEIVNERNYQERISSGDYDVALAILDSDGLGLSGYLKPFGSEKTYGLSTEEVVNFEKSSGKYSSLTTMLRSCAEAENSVLSSYSYIPLWHIPTVCVLSGDSEGIWLDPSTDSPMFENAKSF